ncbi:MAG: sigma-54-dependent Fis family transcriptional regulator [Ignavibacteriae bacterium]|nr:sigma-54-dependent Fis family transcriptional regulator [Ignavibacteriota bacterium]MCB9217680.1 sigma-54-dependent Fis family transcriptional regulator [Ignavibacteria bacterium]
MSRQNGSTILLTDDDKTYLDAVSELLGRAGHDVVSANSGEKALEILSGNGFDIDLALLDIRMPGMDGIETLGKISERHPTLPVIMLTGEDAIDLVVRAMKAGAKNYISKSAGGTELLAAVKTALEERQSYGSVDIDAMEFEEHGIIGRSATLKRVLADAANCARSVISVLITGETGVGKDLLARAIHEMSPRTEKNFVALDVPNIPASMFESELFGHTKGAFTGATDNKQGMVQEAHKGTLFLDEIGEFPIELQAKFLRVLDTGSVRKLGSVKSEEVDVRILSATNRDLLEAVGERKFREDLFYRLRGIEIHLPPLRERKEDIQPLATHFLKEFLERNQMEPKRLSDSGVSFLEEHSWPGNIRELRRTIEAAVILTPGETIEHDDVARVMERSGHVSTASNGNSARDYADVEEMARQTKKNELTKVLERNGWNITRAAAELDIDRSTLSKQMKNLGIKKPKL